MLYVENKYLIYNVFLKYCGILCYDFSRFFVKLLLRLDNFWENIKF